MLTLSGGMMVIHDCSVKNSSAKVCVPALLVRCSGTSAAGLSCSDTPRAPGVLATHPSLLRSEL